MIELVYRRGGDALVLPDGREAGSEFAAARMLIADGHDPATPVHTRWPGSRHHSLSGTLGGWAELRVDEDGMRFRKNMPLPAGHEPAARRFVGEERGGGAATPRKAAGGPRTPPHAGPPFPKPDRGDRDVMTNADVEVAAEPAEKAAAA